MPHCVGTEFRAVVQRRAPHARVQVQPHLVTGAHKTTASDGSRKLGITTPDGTPAAVMTQKWDVFAIGVVLLEAVTGCEPAEGEDGMDLEA